MHDRNIVAGHLDIDGLKIPHILNKEINKRKRCTFRIIDSEIDNMIEMKSCRCKFRVAIVTSDWQRKNDSECSYEIIWYKQNYYNANWRNDGVLNKQG